MHISAVKIKILFVPLNRSLRHRSGRLRYFLRWLQDYRCNFTTTQLASQVSLQKKKQVSKLHVPIKHAHKSLTSVRWRRSGVFIVNFEYISHLALVFLLLALSR